MMSCGPSSAGGTVQVNTEVPGMKSMSAGPATSSNVTGFPSASVAVSSYVYGRPIRASISGWRESITGAQLRPAANAKS